MLDYIEGKVVRTAKAPNRERQEQTDLYRWLIQDEKDAR